MRTFNLMRRQGGDVRRFALAMLAASAALFATPASAQRIDCPLRNERYSLDTPAIDVLLKPEAVAIVEHARPGLLGSIPPTFLSTTPPNFGAILSLRTVLSMARLEPDTVARVDTELRSLRVTDADRVARCARYDVDRPDITFPTGNPRILLFEKMTGFRDGPSVNAARTAFVAMAERHGWSIITTDRGGAITPSILRNVDVIIWNNVSGDVLTLTQRRAFRRFVENGGGFIAVHGSGGDPIYVWDWYVDTLIGARFIGHPINPQFQDARIIVNNDAHIGVDLAPGWTMSDEWYSFASNPADAGARVIASLDESTYSQVGREGQNLRMGEHPIVWTRCVGDGRSFYSAIGHRPETYSDPNYVRLLEQAVTWAANKTTCE